MRTSKTNDYFYALLGKIFEHDMNVLGKVDYSFPPHDIFYDGEKKQLVFLFAVAGFSINELSVTVEDGILIVQGVKEKEEKKENVVFYHKKIAFRDFVIKYSIYDKFDIRKISCSYKDGLLKIVLPEVKKENVDGSIKVKINVQ